MIWIFATVVLLLVVLHPGFRRVMAWLTGGAVVVAAVVFAVVWWRSAHPTVDISDLPVPPAAGAPVPCSDLPDNLRPGSNCTVPAVYDPHDPAQLAEHLKECSHQPGEPAYMAKDKIAADRRNIPCTPFDRFDGAKP